MIDTKTNITSKMVEYNCQYLNSSEIRILMNISDDKEFINTMDILKHKNPSKYNQKMSIYKQQVDDQIKKYEKLKEEPLPQPINIPKCPTCGSTNVHKISATKRWLTTGLFGLASSDATHTYICENCQYKW